MRRCLLCFLGVSPFTRTGMIVLPVQGFQLRSSPFTTVFRRNYIRRRVDHAGTATFKASSDPMSTWGDLDNNAEGDDFMAQLMGEVNQREGLRRKEGVRTLKRPSALLPPHAVLEHVLVSLRTPDFPTDGCGLRQAFLFSALDQEVSRGPVDYRRDWTDPDESEPRYLDRASFDAVTKNVLGFLLGMSEFAVMDPPIFSEDDHRVTIPMRIAPDARTSALRWVAMDFRLGRVREGSHKDCWLVERAIERGREGPPDIPGL